MCPRKCSLHKSVNNTKLSDFNIELVVQILHSEMFPNYMNFQALAYCKFVVKYNYINVQSNKHYNIKPKINVNVGRSFIILYYHNILKCFISTITDNHNLEH